MKELPNTIENIQIDSTADTETKLNELDNVATGGGGANTFSGLEGDDTLNGGNDNDLATSDDSLGGCGEDAIDAVFDNDLIYGHENQDALAIPVTTLCSAAPTRTPCSINDLIYGNEDGDLIYGNQGLDTVFGGQRATIRRGQDEDTVYGGQGEDIGLGQ